MFYQLSIDRVEADAYGQTALVLATEFDGQSLRVRLSPMDAQALAVEHAGIPTARTRLAASYCRLLHMLDARLTGVRLSRSAGNLIEAEALMEGPTGPLTLPMPFGDGIALAIAHRLPLRGDASLSPLLQSTVEHAEPMLPAGIATFLDSLPDM